MDRDFKQYPDDDNGNVLWSLKGRGDDHERPREIEFFLEFSDEEGATECGVTLFKSLFRVELQEPGEDEPGGPWTVVVVPYMPALYEDIRGVEQHLSEVAGDFGGKVTGWGCTVQRAEPSSS